MFRLIYREDLHMVVPGKEEEKQLGDFIRGRLLFVEQLCKERELDKAKTVEAIRDEAMRLAKTPERQAFLDQRVFKGVILSTSMLPDWLDKVLLEAISHVLKGPNAPLFTTTSDQSCIPFEAGRFNARRQADTVFKILFDGKGPEEWLNQSFRVVYQKCYGDAALKDLKIEPMGPNAVRVIMSNRGLEKASPMDCSTVLGYLYGSLEKTGAKNIRILHRLCSTLPGSPHLYCVFEASWK
jgi:hypothetical protein